MPRSGPNENDPDLGRRVEVVPYDPIWPRTFEHERGKIMRALGEVAQSVDHIGSTAVPGLAAKPVIDIHLAVRTSADEGAYRPALEAAGLRFIHRAPDWFEHRLFKGMAPEVNLHVFSTGCPEAARCRLFRDWLRVIASDRELYADVKQRLAARRWEHVQDYAVAKTEVVLQIMSRAEAWARASPRGGPLCSAGRPF